MTQREVTEYLRIANITLYRYEKKGILVPNRIKRGKICIRDWSKEQLDDFINTHMENQ